MRLFFALLVVALVPLSAAAASLYDGSPFSHVALFPVPMFAPSPLPQQDDASATLVLQPWPGRSDFLVSWASVGMDPAHPCELHEAGNPALIDSANQDAGAIEISSAQPKGELIFELRCTARSGETIQRSAGIALR